MFSRSKTLFSLFLRDIFPTFFKKNGHFVTHVPLESIFVKNIICEKVVEKMWTKIITVHTKSIVVESIHYEKVVEKIIIFSDYGGHKILFFRKVIFIPFFCKCLSVTQNGHFFPKNVGKMSDKNSENYVLLRENTFYEK